MFQLASKDYFIEPLSGVLAQPDQAQPHVLYQREAPDERGNSTAAATCWVQGTSVAWTEGSLPGALSILCPASWTKGTGEQQTSSTRCPLDMGHGRPLRSTPLYSSPTFLHIAPAPCHSLQLAQLQNEQCGWFTHISAKPS